MLLLLPGDEQETSLFFPQNAGHPVDIARASWNAASAEVSGTAGPWQSLLRVEGICYFSEFVYGVELTSPNKFAPLEWQISHTGGLKRSLRVAAGT